jgi:co-chaperonin GroES (HSP10)
MNTQDIIEMATESITALNDEVVLVVEKSQRVTEQGVHLPEMSIADQVTGVVAGIGEDLESKSLKIGDRVYFDPFSTNKIKLDGHEIIFAKYENCKAKVNGSRKVEVDL